MDQHDMDFKQTYLKICHQRLCFEANKIKEIWATSTPTVTGANELRRNLLENSCFIMLYSIIQCDALLYKEVSMQFGGG